MSSMEFTREQLIAQVRIDVDAGCWEFTGKRDAYGYGRMFSANSELKAHRVFYEAWVEDVPENLFVRHGLTDQKCIGHACCFPFHLRLSPYRRKLGVALAPSETYIRRSAMLSQIKVLPQTGCWQFQGSSDRGGYGRLFIGDKEQKANEAFFEEWAGAVPNDQFLLPCFPQCIGRRCCNPAHWQVRPKTWKRPDPVLSRVLPVSASVVIVPATVAIHSQPPVRVCPNGHLMTPENIVTENRKGHPKIRCRICRRKSWSKNSARRSAAGLHT